MRTVLFRLGGIALAGLALAGAFAAGRHAWTYYMEAPWTRDGRVAADIIGVAPDVSGLVDDVLVHDNQTVRKGQVLFKIDAERFRLALRQADARVAEARAALAEAERESRRYAGMSELAVSHQKQEQMDAAAQAAEARYQKAQADRALAALDLERSEVKAPADGVITNFDLQPGNYVAAGHGVLALVDSATLRVEGYFEETKLPRIHVGNPVTVRLMGGDVLHGRVESIAAGIADPDRRPGGLLAAINPTFSWVRLAQRVPVRVALDPVPATVRLVVGRTATVAVDGADGLRL